MPRSHRESTGSVEVEGFVAPGARHYLEPCEFRLCGSTEYRAVVWASLWNGSPCVSRLRWRPDGRQDRGWTGLYGLVAAELEDHWTATIAAAAFLLGSRGVQCRSNPTSSLRDACAGSGGTS